MALSTRKKNILGGNTVAGPAGCIPGSLADMLYLRRAKFLLEMEIFL